MVSYVSCSANIHECKVVSFYTEIADMAISDYLFIILKHLVPSVIFFISDIQ